MDDCTICLNRLKNYITLECGHKFHRQCIYKWAKKARNCPLCKKNILFNKCGFCKKEEIYKDWNEGNENHIFNNCKLREILYDYEINHNEKSMIRLMILCCTYGFNNVLEYLLNNYGDLYHADNYLEYIDNFIFNACVNGKIETMDMLFLQGINPDDIYFGETLLTVSAKYELIENIEYLLCIADINTANYKKNTPLIYGCKRDNLEIVKLVLNNNADINVKNCNNLSAVSYAVLGRNKPLINLLNTKQERSILLF